MHSMRRKNAASTSNSASSPVTHSKSSENGNDKAVRRHFLVIRPIITSPYLVCLIFLCVVGWHLHVHSTSPLLSSTSSSTVITASAVKKAEMGQLVYGTNKHRDSTASNVMQAIQMGRYHHIATAGRHTSYDEAAVGKGWRRALSAPPLLGADNGIARREDLFLQTMFVADSNLDYDKNWIPVAVDDATGTKSTPPITIAQQVQSSIQSSLHNLQTTYLDAVLYHNLKSKLDPYDKVLEVWRELEGAVDKGTIRYLGITNCHDLNYLERLYNDTRIKPTIIQNRFHANRQFNVPLRPFIQQHHLVWQAFWILTGNGRVVGGKAARKFGTKNNVTSQQLIFAFVLSIGATPMIGSKSVQHLQQDIDVARRFNSSSTSSLAFFNNRDDRKEFAQALGNADLVV